EEMSANPAWSQLSAVKSNQVYLTDGNQYFNRPGPRLVESYEILSEIIQGLPVDQNRQPRGWRSMAL
ncbi:MAG: cobalamin-binding protein, partial [Cyanobacteria bacterium J06598_3]